VQIVKRDRKASTSYIQRRLQIGYNRAASLMERMELEASSDRPITPASAKFWSKKKKVAFETPDPAKEPSYFHGKTISASIKSTIKEPKASRTTR